jgi:hypothetical protein
MRLACGLSPFYEQGEKTMKLHIVDRISGKRNPAAYDRLPSDPVLFPATAAEDAVLALKQRAFKEHQAALRRDAKVILAASRAFGAVTITTIERI